MCGSPLISEGNGTVPTIRGSAFQLFENAQDCEVRVNQDSVRAMRRNELKVGLLTRSFYRAKIDGFAALGDGIKRNQGQEGIGNTSLTKASANHGFAVLFVNGISHLVARDSVAANPLVKKPIQ